MSQISFKKLGKQEKIARIIRCNPCCNERNVISRYVVALQEDNTDEIAYFESFGEDVRQIIQNAATYEQGLLFGFTDKNLNECGWLHCQVDVVEKIELSASNCISIGRTPNGKYVVGTDWCTGAGGGAPLGIWGASFDTFKEAVKAGVKELQKRYDYALQCSKDNFNYNGKKTRALIVNLNGIKQRYLEPQQLVFVFSE